MNNRCRNCESKLGKVRSPRTDIEYCIQCGAALSRDQFEQHYGEKTADENDTGHEVDDSLKDT